MKDYKSDLWRNYMRYRNDLYQAISPQTAEGSMISEANWVERSRYFSGEDMGIFVEPAISAIWISASSISMRQVISTSGW